MYTQLRSQPLILQHNKYYFSTRRYTALLLMTVLSVCLSVRPSVSELSFLYYRPRDCANAARQCFRLHMSVCLSVRPSVCNAPTFENRIVDIIKVIRSKSWRSQPHRSKKTCLRVARLCSLKQVNPGSC